MSDYYLKIDGVPGDTNERGLEGWLVPTSLTWQTNSNGAGGGGPGRAHIDRFSTTLRDGRHGPVLFSKSSTGEPIRSAELRGFNGKGLVVSVMMQDLIVESCRHATGITGPEVELVVSYGKIKFSYGPPIAPRDAQNGLPVGRR